MLIGVRANKDGGQQFECVSWGSLLHYLKAITEPRFADAKLERDTYRSWRLSRQETWRLESGAKLCGHIKSSNACRSFVGEQ